MIKIAICDDFLEDRLVISNLVSEYFDKKNALYKITFFEKCENLVDEYQEFSALFNLIFLDVYTSGMNGLEAAHIIREFDINVPIIFATNSVDDAIHGYDVNASGYLLKPINKEKCFKVLEKLNIVNEIKDKEILVKVKTGFRNFKFDEICYLESNRNVVNIYTKDNQIFSVYSKLNDLETQLNDPRFLRCHQSYLVNLNYVSQADETFVMKNGDIVPIRVREHKEIIDKYYFYFFESEKEHRV